MSDGTLGAARWKRNALFRVLAFLDNTGVQTFDLVEDTNGPDGEFEHCRVTFGESTAIAAVLHSLLVALRRNVLRLFTDPDERRALLDYFGIQGVEEELAQLTAPQDSATSSHAAVTPLALLEAAALGSATAELSDTPVPAPTTVAQSSHKEAALPTSTQLADAIQHPRSLVAASKAIEEALPLHLYSRLCEVLGVPVTASADEGSDTPLLEQLFIDGLDQWMTTRALEENRQLVLACGVQPTLVDQVCLKSPEEATRLFVDFVVDVVFPPSAATVDNGDWGDEDNRSPAAGGRVLDWLRLSYEKNHEIVDVEDEESAASDDNDNDNDVVAGKHDDRVEGGTDGLGGWTPEDGEVVLTEDNVDEYMKTHPEWIPVEVVREKRRPWTSRDITQFELTHHYDLTELRSAAREVADSVDDAAMQTALEARLGHAIPARALTLARAARKKTDLVAALLALHAQAPAAAREEEHAHDHDQSHPANTPDASQQSNGQHTEDTTSVDTSLSAKALEKQYTLAQLKAHITAYFPDETVPATKPKCAKLIKACTKDSSRS